MEDDVRRWVEAYERVWRSPGTEDVATLFTPDATYLPSPWAHELVGLPAIEAFWEAERDGADEEFTLTWEVVAADGSTGIVRAEVVYARPEAGSWRDLWVIRLDADGRCSHFEEWPFAPGQPDGH